MFDQTKYLDEVLTPSDGRPVFYRHHWWWLVQRMQIPATSFLVVAAFAIYFAITASTAALLPAIIIPAIWMAVEYMRYMKTLVVITNTRVMLLGGIINRYADKDDMSLVQVQNVDTKAARGLLAGWFGMKVITLQAGTSRLLLNGFAEEIGDIVSEKRSLARAAAGYFD